MYLGNLLGIYSVTSTKLGAQSSFLGGLSVESLQVPSVFWFII